MGARTNRLKSAVHVVCGQLGPLDLEIMPSRLHSCNACELTGVLVSVCRELYSRFFDAFALEGEPNIPIDRQIMQSPEFYSLLERLRQHAELHQRDHWQVVWGAKPDLMGHESWLMADGTCLWLMALDSLLIAHSSRLMADSCRTDLALQAPRLLDQARIECSSCGKWRIISYAKMTEAKDTEWVCRLLRPPYSSCRTPQTKRELLGVRYAVQGVDGCESMDELAPPGQPQVAPQHELGAHSHQPKACSNAFEAPQTIISDQATTSKDPTAAAAGATQAAMQGASRIAQTDMALDDTPLPKVMSSGSTDSSDSSCTNALPQTGATFSPASPAAASFSPSSPSAASPAAASPAAASPDAASSSPSSPNPPCPAAASPAATSSGPSRLSSPNPSSPAAAFPSPSSPSPLSPAAAAPAAASPRASPGPAQSRPHQPTPAPPQDRPDHQRVAPNQSLLPVDSSTEALAASSTLLDAPVMPCTSRTLTAGNTPPVDQIPGDLAAESVTTSTGGALTAEVVLQGNRTSRGSSRGVSRGGDAASAGDVVLQRREAGVAVEPKPAVADPKPTVVEPRPAVAEEDISRWIHLPRQAYRGRGRAAPGASSAEEPWQVLTALELGRQARIAANRAYLVGLQLGPEAMSQGHIRPLQVADPAMLAAARQLATTAALTQAKSQLDEARKQLDARQKTRAREESRLRSALTNLEAQAAADAQQVVSAQQAHEELLQDLPAYLSPVTQTRPRSPPTSLAPNCKVGQPAPAKAVHVPAARALAPTPAACPFPKKTDPPKLVPSHAALTDVVHALVPQHKVSSASAKVAGMMPVSMAPKASLASARQTTRMQQAGRRPACLQQALPPIRHPSTAVEQSAQLAPLPPGAYCMQWLAAASTQAQAQTHPQARAQAQAQAYPQAQAQAQAALFQTIAAAQKVSKPPLNQYMLPPSGQTRYPSAACSSGPAPAVAIAGHALTQKTAAALTGVNKHLLHTGAKTLQQGLRTQQTSLMSQQMAIRAQQATQQPAAWSRRTAPALHAVQPAAAPSTIFLTQSGASAPAASAPPAFPLLGQATTPMHPVPGQQRLSAASPAQASSSEVLTAQPAFSQVECPHFRAQQQLNPQELESVLLRAWELNAHAARPWCHRSPAREFVPASTCRRP
ncbi:hypothetical protein ABBQ38_008385 [Trebouxia sp. C0009 RCD-2024]